MQALIDFLTYRQDDPMIFSSPVFWLFFTCVMLVYSFLYKSNPLRNLYLLIISFFFYYKSGGIFFSLLIFSTLVDFFAGKAIYKSRSKKKKRFFLILSLLSNLIVLGYFKYAYFFTELINQIFNTDFVAKDYLSMLSNSLFQTGFDISSITLPVGISFFTFQTISYSVDVYRGRIEPVRNIVDFGFYVSFFPQLVAGPIVRAAQFIPQLYQQFSLTREQFGHALFLIISGLVKKMIVSDYISINFVDRVFGDPSSYTGFENLLALYGYAVQIYCDFSGYTDIAIGLAMMLGFRLPVNFNSPYKAVNITDFWRRWHISLSTWLRDYLYIPLGGNRKGWVRTQLNLLVTMLLGGLWHGANIRFVIWGGIHGLSLIIDKGWKRINPVKNRDNQLYKFISILFTFHLICFTWIFFRAPSFHKANMMLYQIFNQFHPELILKVITAYRTSFLLIFWALLIHWLPSEIKETYRGVFIRTPVFLKAVAFIVFILLIYQFRVAGLQPFIYFQF